MGGYYDDAYPDEPDEYESSLLEILDSRCASELLRDDPKLIEPLVLSMLEYFGGLYHDFSYNNEFDEKVSTALVLAGWLDDDIRELAESHKIYCPWCENTGTYYYYRGENKGNGELPCPVCG